MSFQAITDILVNPQIADLQLSNTVKTSQTDDYAVSFNDLVASYKEEKTEDNAPVQENQKDVAEKTVKDEAKSEVRDSEEPAETKETEKKVDVKEVKTENTKTSEKSSKEKNLETKKSEKQPKVEAKDAKKQTAKDVQKDSKLNDKDFARIEQLDASKNENVQNLVSENVAKNLKTQETDNKAEPKDETPVLEFTAQAEVALNEVTTSPAEEDSKLDFDFNKDSSKQKSELKLDKDGKITVQDERTQKIEVAESKKSELKVTDVKFTNDNTATITMDLNQTEANVLSLNNQSAASDGSNFQSMLNNQIQANVPEFVKAGNIILKDNDQGTINLVLHPDDLGNVKIHLTMDGKSVTGHITVATKEALQVFKDNAETLREAFIKSGFDAANFEVAYGNGGSNQNMEFAQQQDGTNLLAQKVYGSGHVAQSLDSQLDSFIGNEENFSEFSINIVA